MPAANATSPIDFRPDAPEFLADPYPIYRHLRERDPVHWSPRLKAWVLTRYDDVKSVLLDRTISSDRMRPFFATLPGPEAARIGDIVTYLSTWMVFRDPLAMVKRLSDDMALFIGSSRMAREKYAIAERATKEMAAFFVELIQDRR